jgi:hypothetical protein
MITEIQTLNAINHSIVAFFFVYYPRYFFKPKFTAPADISDPLPPL